MYHKHGCLGITRVLWRPKVAIIDEEQIYHFRQVKYTLTAMQAADNTHLLVCTRCFWSPTHALKETMLLFRN